MSVYDSLAKPDAWSFFKVADLIVIEGGAHLQSRNCVGACKEPDVYVVAIVEVVLVARTIDIWSNGVAPSRTRTNNSGQVFPTEPRP